MSHPFGSDHQVLGSGTSVELPTPRPGPDNSLSLAWNRGALRQPRVVHARDRLTAALAAEDRIGGAPF